MLMSYHSWENAPQSDATLTVTIVVAALQHSGSIKTVTQALQWGNRDILYVKRVSASSPVSTSPSLLPTLFSLLHFFPLLTHVL